MTICSYLSQRRLPGGLRQAGHHLLLGLNLLWQFLRDDVDVDVGLLLHSLHQALGGRARGGRQEVLQLLAEALDPAVKVLE